MRDAGAKRILCCVACVLVLGAMALGALAWGASELAPAAPRPPLAAGAVREAAAPPAVAAAPAVERRDVAAAPGVYVVLLDNAGSPVFLGEGSPGRSYVRLDRAGEGAEESRQLVPAPPSREEDCRLFWHHPGAGRFVVSACDGACRAEFDLSAGASREVELRLPPEVVVVTLRFTRDGERERGVRASLRQRDADAIFAHPDRDGDLTLLLRAGPWSVVPKRGFAGVDRPLSLGEVSLTVPAGRARAEFSLPLAGTRLDVYVVDVDGVPVAGADVELAGCTSFEDEPVSLPAHTGPSGHVHWSMLPAGDWRLRVHGKRLVADELPPLPIVAGERRLVRTVVVERAVVLRLHLHDALGAPFTPVDAPMPLLGTRRGDVSCQRKVGRGTLRDVVLRYDGVVAGAATLRCGDRQQDGEWQLLPFDALPDELLTIAADEDCDLALQVEPRALVELIACERGGRERISGQLVVLRDGVPVRPVAVERASRWRGYLPPGDYVAVVTDGALRVERVVTIGRRKLQLRLRV